MTLRAWVVAIIAASLAGCWDFIEPDFPGAGAPAVFQATVTVDEGGKGNLGGLLVPGLASSGFLREIRNDSLLVNGKRIAPVNVRENATREYQISGFIGDSTVTVPPVLDLLPPRVDDIASAPLHVRWYGVRKLDPDTITWVPGTDLVLRIDTAQATPEPFPQIRQWFLDINGVTRSYRISSDGLPPATLVIPPAFVPAPANNRIVVTMLWYQTGQYRSPAGDYITNVTLSVALTWIVRVVVAD